MTSWHQAHQDRLQRATVAGLGRCRLAASARTAGASAAAGGATVAGVVDRCDLVAGDRLPAAAEVDQITYARTATRRQGPRSQPVGLTAGSSDRGLRQLDLEKSFAMTACIYIDQGGSRASSCCENLKNVLRWRCSIIPLRPKRRNERGSNV